MDGEIGILRLGSCAVRVEDRDEEATRESGRSRVGEVGAATSGPLIPEHLWHAGRRRSLEDGTRPPTGSPGCFATRAIEPSTTSLPAPSLAMEDRLGPRLLVGVAQVQQPLSVDRRSAVTAEDGRGGSTNARRRRGRRAVGGATGRSRLGGRVQVSSSEERSEPVQASRLRERKSSTAPRTAAG